MERAGRSIQPGVLVVVHSSDSSQYSVGHWASSHMRERGHLLYLHHTADQVETLRVDTGSAQAERDNTGFLIGCYTSPSHCLAVSAVREIFNRQVRVLVEIIQFQQD